MDEKITLNGAFEALNASFDSSHPSVKCLAWLLHQERLGKSEIPSSSDKSSSSSNSAPQDTSSASKAEGNSA